MRRDASSPCTFSVTGAAGFIGSHLTEELLRRGHRVIGVDRRDPRSDPSSASNLRSALLNPDFELRTVDLANADTVEALDGSEGVFHLAGLPGVRNSWGRGFAGYITDNIDVTHRVLEACDSLQIRRVVFASSSSVYGQTANVSRETDPTEPISPYGVTKLAAEKLAIAYARHPSSQLKAVALRYFTVYGPRQRPDMGIQRMITAALTGEPMKLFGDGTQRREFTYVSDIVDATIRAMLSPTLSQDIINVGGGSSVTVRDVLEVVAAATGAVVPLKNAASAPGDVNVTAADLSVARRVLGYEPNVPLEMGIKSQVQWFQERA